MPFTAAHPALILPLQRLHSRWFSSTGLIVGSIAPDFAYFLPPVYDLGKLSHSLKGLLYFDLPMTLVLAILFHGLLREQLLENLPDYFRKRALPVKPVKLSSYLPRNWHIFAVSALIGSFTHLFWDSFTHYNEYFVRNYSFLMQPVSVGALKLPLSRVIQHASTVVGLSVILWHINTLPVAPIAQRSWFTIMPYWILVGFIGGVIMLLNLPASLNLSNLEKLVVPFLTGIVAAVILLAIVRKVSLWIYSRK